MQIYNLRLSWFSFSEAKRLYQSPFVTNVLQILFTSSCLDLHIFCAGYGFDWAQIIRLPEIFLLEFQDYFVGKGKVFPHD